MPLYHGKQLFVFEIWLSSLGVTGREMKGDDLSGDYFRKAIREDFIDRKQHIVVITHDERLMTQNRAIHRPSAAIFVDAFKAGRLVWRSCNCLPEEHQ